MLSGLPVPVALNFGPSEEFTVAQVATMAAADWGAGAAWKQVPGHAFEETQLLALDSGLAAETIGWRPTWDTPESVSRTVAWWKAWNRGAEPSALCLEDIEAFRPAD